MSQSIKPLDLMATAPLNSSAKRSGSWFEAMAEAWGKTLDHNATQIEETSAKIGAGDDKPATITQLSVQSLQMGFLSNASHNAVSSAGEALKTTAQK